MIKLLFYTLIFLIGGAVLMELIRTDSGYVLISYGPKTIEMSFWFGVVCLFVFILVLWFVIKYIRKMIYTLEGTVSWLSESREKRAEKRTQSGMIHFIEGNWRDAKKDLLSAAKASDKPLVQYLAAARSAYEMGELEETTFLLQQAEKIAPQDELAIILTQARMQLSTEQYEQCLATLERAKKIAPENPVVLDLYKQVYWHLHNWDALIQLLPQIKASKQYSKEQENALEEEIYTSYVATFAKQFTGEQLVSKLDNSWGRIPKSLRKNPKLIAVYARVLMSEKQHNKSEAILRAVLKEHWDHHLVELYGLTESDQKKDQLATAERWLRDHPTDSVLLLALGRIAKRNELWGKAKDYFSASLRFNESPETYAELAALMAQLGEHEESTSLYKKGLTLAAR